MGKKLKWNLVLMSLLYLGLGIFLLLVPGTALNIVCYALGGVVLACAAVQLVRYFAVERGVFQSQLTLISGLVCLALGVFLLLRSDVVVSILPIVFGLFVIFDAIGRVQNALDLRRCAGQHHTAQRVANDVQRRAGLHDQKNAQSDIQQAHEDQVPLQLFYHRDHVPFVCRAAARTRVSGTGVRWWSC